MRSLWLVPLLLLALSARADDPSEHARSCACGKACRGKSCCCDKRAAAPKPTRVEPSTCVAADPCGDRGDIPSPAPTPPWARIAGLSASTMIGADATAVDRALPADAPLPLDPVGRRPDEPPEAGSP